MLSSMTGFGAAQAESKHGSYRVEVRTVNHRHLLVKSRLPGEFAHLEGDVERGVRRRLVRGAVTVLVNATRHAGAEAVALDAEVAARYQQQWKRLASSLGLEPTLSPATLLGLPGVVAAREGGAVDQEAEDRQVLKLLDQALEPLVRMRKVEGAALESDLRKHAAACGKIVVRIEKRMPTVVRGHQANLRRRVDELLEGRGRLEPHDLAREVALLADRLDGAEEISRLKSHLDQLETILAKGGAVGRKLDFLMQEIFREVNTTGSKCSDVKVSHWTVEAKTHVERLREQVQNVE